METPLTHLTTEDFNYIYEPSEDTFLLLDSLSDDLSLIRSIKPSICVEVGCGSGVIITALATHIPESKHFAIDINPKACEVTLNTSHHNKCHVEIINADLLNSFRLDGLVDVLIFNPPYVVTDSEEMKSFGPDGLLACSWAGGVKGREVMDRLFPDVSSLLSKNGFFYLVIIAENQKEEIKQLMNEYGFEMTVIKERKIRGEHLHVLRFTRKNTN